jgi:hypothetical protein
MNTTAEQQQQTIANRRKLVHVAMIRWTNDPEDQRMTVLAIETLQNYLEALQAVPIPPLPADAADVISRYFISPPENVEIISSDYLGGNCWNVETRVTYAGTDKPEPRPFLLVLSDAGKLLVNP